VQDPAPAGCLTDGRFLRREPGQPGNYPMDLLSAAQCLTRLGSSGCGFEQPLEAIRLAIAPGQPNNLGFLRDDAALLVVVMTNEDDCSAKPELFVAETGELGPRISFRCTRFALKCNGQEINALGSYENCKVDDDSAYMTHLSVFRDALVARKGNAGRVAVVTLAGGPTPFYVHESPDFQEGYPILGPSCGRPEPRFDATPALRLSAFAEMFPRHQVGSLCSDITASMQAAADLALAAMQ
jgi:hypothetical protein